MTLEAGTAQAGGPDRQWPDHRLLHLTAEGSREAFAEIVARYYQPVYRLAWRLTGGHRDSEDIAQQAFLKLWQDPRQIREAAALKGWLMRVAANAVIDRGRRPRTAELDQVPEPPDPAAGPDRQLDRSQAAQLVDAAIAALPERQRLALALVYYEGLSNIDAAATMEVSVEAVESLLARARRSLKESLSGAWRDLLAGLTETGS